MALDFSLLGRGPQFHNVLGAYEAGKETRRQSNIQSVLAQAGGNPAGAVDMMRQYDPQLARQMNADLLAQQDRDLKQRAEQDRRDVFAMKDPGDRRAKALELGDPETIRAVSAMDADQRAQAKQRADVIGGFLYTLRSKVKDPAARRQAIADNAANLEGVGFTPDQIAAFDPTDQNIDLLLGKTLELDTLLSLDEAESDARSGLLKEELTRAQIGATNDLGVQRRASAAKAARPSGSGGGGSGAAGPWKRNWD